MVTVEQAQKQVQEQQAQIEQARQQAQAQQQALAQQQAQIEAARMPQQTKAQLLQRTMQQRVQLKEQSRRLNLEKARAAKQLKSYEAEKLQPFVQQITEAEQQVSGVQAQIRDVQREQSEWQQAAQIARSPRLWIYKQTLPQSVRKKINMILEGRRAQQEGKLFVDAPQFQQIEDLPLIQQLDLQQSLGQQAGTYYVPGQGYMSIDPSQVGGLPPGAVYAGAPGEVPQVDIQQLTAPPELPFEVPQVSIVPPTQYAWYDPRRYKGAISRAVPGLREFTVRAEQFVAGLTPDLKRGDIVYQTRRGYVKELPYGLSPFYSEATPAFRVQAVDETGRATVIPTDTTTFVGLAAQVPERIAKGVDPTVRRIEDVFATLRRGTTPRYEELVEAGLIREGEPVRVAEQRLKQLSELYGQYALFVGLEPLMRVGAAKKTTKTKTVAKTKKQIKDIKKLKDTLKKLSDAELKIAVKAKLQEISKITDKTARELETLRLYSIVREVKTGEKLITESGNVIVRLDSPFAETVEKLDINSLVEYVVETPIELAGISTIEVAAITPEIRGPRIVTGLPTTKEGEFAGLGLYERAEVVSAPIVLGAKPTEKWLYETKTLDQMGKVKALPRLKEAQFLGTGVLELTKQAQRAAQKQRARLGQAQFFRAATAQKAAQALRTRQIQRQVQRQIPKFKDPLRPRLKPRVPSKIPLGLPEEERIFGRRRRLKRKYPTAFRVEVRRRGKFVPIGAPLVKGEALAFGRKVTKAEAAATFRLQPVKAKPTTLGLPKIRERALFGEFRKPIRRGRPVGDALTFIQRREKRIMTPGEKREITFKGIAARRKKVKWL